MSGWAWLAVGALGVLGLLWLVGMFCGGYELSGAVLRGLLRMGHCDDPWADARGSRRRRRGVDELDDGDDPWNGTRAAPPRDFAPSAPAVGDAVRLLVPLPACAGGPTVPRGTQGVVMDVADLGHEGRAYLVSLGARLDAQRNARPVLRASQFERLYRRRRAG
ncbi:MAG TPA: hypothetical protein PLZ13_17710 [Ottowia sp.]|nr:hypothetical protein [Ottowia sp.]